MFLSALVHDTTAIAVFYKRGFLQAIHPHASRLQLVPCVHSGKSAVVADSLRLLEWDKVCDAVSSFAGTPLGREATLAQLWSVDVAYTESRRLLDETTAAVEMIKYGAGGLDFSGVDVILVKSGIDHASRGLPIGGIEAKAVVSLIQFVEALQLILKTAVREDADLYSRFVPLAQMILDVAISRPFIKSVEQVIDEDGSVKDTASSELKRARDQVRTLERKLSQLMDKLIRNGTNEAYSVEVSNINGRWCLKTMDDCLTKFDGLLLSRHSFSEGQLLTQLSEELGHQTYNMIRVHSGNPGQALGTNGSGLGGLIEPIAAVTLNDELQHAMASVAKAEDDVLSRLTDKMLAELDAIQDMLRKIVQFDAVIARAKYSIAYGGSYPELFMPGDKFGVFSADESSDRNCNKSFPSDLSPRKWKLYIPKACHPLLLQKHSDNLNKAKKDVANTIADIRRRRLQGSLNDEMEKQLVSLKLRVADLENDHPVPVDFMVPLNTGVLVITGPNTGGKTISLKTVGLASLMAKMGLYVLASEPVQIPWFDAIFADIGDEQSLTQSLSTFSGHLKQISAIRLHSSSKSLVLLDEVGAGTNPLEGAALGMSILESFAQNGSFLTMASTHHGELKTLKYSNYAFENACVEFDEESLKPTYKILWGVPGRSNAINIAERLGLPSNVLDSARKLHGAASAEINGVILDMERCKQDFQQDLQEAQHYLTLSRELRENLIIARERVIAHTSSERNRKVKAISDTAVIARSILRNQLEHFRESTATQKSSQNVATQSRASSTEALKQPLSSDSSTEKKQAADNCSSSTGTLKHSMADTYEGRIGSLETSKQAPGIDIVLPDVGDTVHVPSLGKQVMVLKVEASKGTILVQASNMKLRLKLRDIQIPRLRTKKG